jgi:hypothetical protein
LSDAPRSFEEAISRHRLLSDQELSRVERGATDEDVSRLLREYRLCRALLREALGKHERLMRLGAAEAEGGREQGRIRSHKR